MTRLPRIFVDKIEPGQRLSCLSKRQAHYLVNVLRLEPGSAVTIATNDGDGRYIGKLTSSSGLLAIEIIEETTPEPPLSCVTTLYFALTKGHKTDLVAEKATELGVPTLVFWQADHSIIKIASESERLCKLARLQRVAEAAAKQSQKDYLPRIELFASTDALLEELSRKPQLDKQCFMGSLLPHAPFVGEIKPRGHSVHLLIGPEGDLSRRETAVFHEAGFSPINLGPYILRAETAALAGIAILQTVWGWPRS